MKRILMIMLIGLAVSPAFSQTKNSEKSAPPFRWVNPLPAGAGCPGLYHATFKSPSMGVDVGYCIYLPPNYEKTTSRFPVVYYLHGGRPGNELKSIRMAELFHQYIRAGDVKPMIYVFVNGGKVSHYNMPEMNSMGEDVFVKELIPHIDQTYRTIPDRSGRGLEGFSQGGRGTTRIMFEYPELFCSAAPGGSGYAAEKKISENDGWENAHLHFQPGANAYDRAWKYTENPIPKLSIMIHVGTAEQNYESNMAYMKFLDSLDIPYQKTIAEGAGHSAAGIYEKVGPVIMKFHEKNFEAAR
jgi:endo-1,4-beta-xylanase